MTTPYSHGRTRKRSLTAAAKSLRRWWWMTVTEGMPKTLRDAELVLSEKRIEMTLPVRLRGRPDQVYRLDRGRGGLVVLDTKRGLERLVTLDIVIQLSVYAVILRHVPLPGHEGAGVAPWAFVRFKLPGQRPRYERVDLWPNEDVFALCRGHHARRRVAREHWPPVKEAIAGLTAHGLSLADAVMVLDEDLRA